jgi:DNA-binding LytR/AlgR family response regulator
MPLHVLVVDDEAPALAELAYLLAQDDRIATVETADSAAQALRALEDGEFDVIFLDIHMPGLSGLNLARVLARFSAPPPIVFVTAYEQHAVEAFDLSAVDYVLKPVQQSRLAEAVRRVNEASGQDALSPLDDDPLIPVELGGVTRFIRRSDVRYAESQGDYVRLHTAVGSHLVRGSLTMLDDQWRDSGFVRIHRQHLIAIAHIREIRLESGRCTVLVDDIELPVSRRHTRELRDLLVRNAQLKAPS